MTNFASMPDYSRPVCADCRERYTMDLILWEVRNPGQIYPDTQADFCCVEWCNCECHYWPALGEGERDPDD